ncbi:Hypothetical predicted protein, partial [Marmota monax]
ELTPSTERPSSGSRNFPGPGLGARGNCVSVRVLLRAGQDSPVAWVARQGERNAAIRIGYQHGRDLMSAESGGGEIFINTSGDISSWSPGNGGEAQSPESPQFVLEPEGRSRAAASPRSRPSGSPAW